MTLIEYITSLQDTGLSQEEIFAKAQEFKGRTETTVEEVKTNDSQKDPSLESENNTGSELASGSSQPVESGGRTKEQQAQYDKITAIAKPEEVITKNGYDFKYDASGVYFYKPKGSDNGSWKTYEDKQSVANLSIASQFGHSEFNLDEYNKTKDTLKKAEELYIGIDGGLNIGEAKQRTLSPKLSLIHI